MFVFSFETIHNICIYDVEFAPTMRSAMKVWNMTVQWWMANYVYQKLPIKSSQIRCYLKSWYYKKMSKCDWFKYYSIINYKIIKIKKNSHYILKLN